MTVSNFLNTLAVYCQAGEKDGHFTQTVFENMVSNVDEKYLPQDESTYRKYFNGSSGVSVDVAQKIISKASAVCFINFLHTRVSSDVASRMKVAFGFEEDMDLDVFYEKLFDQFVEYMEEIAGTKSSNTFSPKPSLKEKALTLKNSIYNSNKQEYLISRHTGGRFANLDIISLLLPHGQLVNANFVEHGKTEDGSIKPLKKLLDEYEGDNVSVIGEGGIGKTTSLMKIMEAAYTTDYDKAVPVPVFIELNQCTSQIGQWYSQRNRKTNFITRYIAAQMEVCELDEVSSSNLNLIEEDFAKDNESGSVDYILLLDGFNEVSLEKTSTKNGASSYIRKLLNEEIKALMGLPNVRIITTSRKMDMAYFSGMTKNIELAGVQSYDIEKYLREKQFDEIEIKSIMSSHKLMDCLRIPLFLCLFTANDEDAERRPATRGEILYRFFHNSKSVYNERLNVQRTKMTSSLNEQQMLFVLDFVIPYIGYMMEWAGRLYSRKPEILEAIEAFLENKDGHVSFWDKKTTAFHDYEKMEEQRLWDIRESLLKKGSGEVLSCIVNTFGIMCRGGRSESRDSFRYYFLHHHIRDYFASIYEIQRMRMAIDFRREFQESKRFEFVEYAFDSLHDVNEEIWSEMKQVFIGEILCEHRNAPIMDTKGKWKMPPITFEEQLYLRAVLDIFRLADKRTLYGVYNVIETMKKARVNLAGEDFSSLDLSQCRFHGTTLSIGRKENMLSASFKDAVLSEATFQAEGDCGEIVEFAYSVMGTSLFTISEDGIAKCWETDTSKCLCSVKIPNWDYYSNKSAINHFVVSSKEHVFLTHGVLSSEKGEFETCFVQELSFAGDCHVEYTNDIMNSYIRSMRYSVDGKHIISVIDSDAGENYLYLYESGEPKYIYEFQANRADTIVTALMVNQNEIIMLICNLELNLAKVELTCRFDSLNIQTNECRTLHEFNTLACQRTAMLTKPVARRVPVFCVSDTGDRISFIDSGFIGEYNLESKEMTKTSQKLEYIPEFMNYLASDKDYIVVAHKKNAHKYHLRDEYEAEIFTQKNFGFDVKGVFSGSKFLIFDHDTICYEWDIAKDTIQLKYKHHMMRVISMFTNSVATEIIATYDNDGVVFVDVETGRLSNTINIGERDVSSGMCVYDKSRNILVALLESATYEFVRSFDAFTCGTRRSYFDFVSKHKMRSIEIAPSSRHLLCAFDRKVSVIDLETLELSDIYVADSNEEIRVAHFFGDESVKMAVCKKTNSLISSLGAAWIYEFQKNAEGIYYKSASYKPPTVPIEMLNDYVSGSNITFDIENDNSLNNLCLDAGVFLNRSEDLIPILSVDKHIWDENGSTSVAKYIPQQNEFYYVCYPESFDSQETLLASNEDRSLIVTLELQSQQISILKYGEGKYSGIRSLSFEDGLVEGCIIHDETLLYFLCSENRIFSIDLKTDVKVDYPSYTPNLIVIGCDFRGAEVNEGTRSTLLEHGGVF